MTDTPLLDVVDLSKHFRGVVAIDAVSFAVQAGTVTSVIGPNGAGKSTLFNLITGYLEPSAGSVAFQGQKITGIGTHRIAERGIARAFQIARPFRDLTVADNIRVGALFGKRGARDVTATIARALALTGLADLADRPAYSLTVGQLRHLEIARAIATRADLLLADEPCAGLNPTETATMIGLLRLIRSQGVTVLLVEHDMPSVMEVSDRIIVLDAGRRIAEGSPAEIAADPRVIAAYLGTAEEGQGSG